MTLFKEDVDKFTERLRELKYWELWNCIDEDLKRLYEPTDPFSSSDNFISCFSSRTSQPFFQLEQNSQSHQETIQKQSGWELFHQ